MIYTRAVAPTAQAQLAPDAYAACWEEGRRLAWTEAIGYALGDRALA